MVELYGMDSPQGWIWVEDKIMAKETATYISQLVATNPVASDSVSVGDDHLRMLKTVLKTQFSGLTGTTAITSTEAEMNYLDLATLGTSADSKVLTQASGVVTIAGDVVISGTTPKITIGDAGAEDSMLAFDGNAVDFHISLDDTADDLVIGTGVAAGSARAISIDGGGTLATTFYGDVIMGGTTPTLTIGDAGAEDASILFDGNAKDFHIGLDDTSDKLVIGVDAALGTNTILTLTDDIVTLGDGAAVDTYLNFDGNTVDYRIGIDDGTDKLEIGAAVAHGTTTAIAIDSAADMTLGGYINFSDEQAIRPEIKDYAETKVAMSANAVDLSLGNVQTYTLSGNQTLTFTNPPATGKAGSFTLIVTNGGSATLTWPTSVDWGGGSAPSLTSSGIDILTFMTIDAGTIWYGFAAGTDMK
jgi:hypothetical protein